MENIEYIKYAGAHRKILKQIGKRVYTKIAPLTAEISITGEPVAVENISQLKFEQISHGKDWGGLYTSAWFRIVGQVPKNADCSNLVVRIDIGGEGLYFVDGKPIQGISDVVSYIDYVQPSQGKSVIYLNSVKGGDTVDMYFDGGYNGWFNNLIGRGKYEYAHLATVRRDILDYYYDYLTLAYLYVGAGDKQQKGQLDALLRDSANAAGDFSPQNVAKAREILAPQFVGGTNEFVFSAIGHAHLDLAWLWPVRETRRKSARTFANQIVNSDRYPQYIFGASQPEQFEYIKKRFPDQYAKIKQKIAEGKFEPQGAMWVEADTNLASGEALIRQLYYGKNFFRDEFNKDMKICWLPDVFGYNGNLPQILAKSDVPYFMTTKLSWNEHNKFPHRAFNWQGIDGSSVLVHMAPDDSYNSAGSPACLKHAYENFPEKDVLNEALMVFGIGDGGAGPGEGHIELLKRQQHIQNAPRIRFEAAVDFFDRLATKKDLLKTHQGELYLEKHQGTYTTQGRNKRFNRKLEYAICNLEALNAFAYTKGIEYDHEFFDGIWKEFLLYQFHDILPGSSITRVYDESREGYERIQNAVFAKQSEVVAQMAKLQEHKAQNHLLRFNPTSYDFDSYLEIDGKWYKAFAKPYSTAQLTEVTQQKFDVKFDQNSIENDLLRVVFDKNGEIVSLIDKTTKAEYCNGYLNRLNIYRDPKLHYNAWDIKIGYNQKRPKTLKAFKCQTFVDGATVFRVNYYKHGKTTMTQKISLTCGSCQVLFDTICNYDQTHKMLRAEFAPAIVANTVKCDIQMGSIERSTADKNKYEKAQFEICAHKYVDLFDGKRGIALLNDCKYGHRVKDGVISLNLVRSPVFPDPQADRCTHYFSYALYPHQGEASVEIQKQAYQLNKPTFAVPCEIASIAQTSNKAVVVETVKKAEKDNAIVVRLYEGCGKPNACQLEVGFEFDLVTEVNLLEEGQGTCDIKNLQFSPFEIKTLKFTLKNNTK